MLDIHVKDLTDTIRLIDENAEIHEFNLKNELKINEAILPQEFLNQPNKYLYWGSVLEKVNMYLDSAQLEFDVLQANLRDEGRSYYLAKQISKPNAQMLEDYAMRQPSWQEKNKQIIGYEYMVKQLKLIVKSFEQRASMLQSYGALKRNETNFGNHAGDVGQGYDY